MSETPDERLSTCQIDAIDALLDFAEAVEKGSLSIADLAEAMSEAISEGKDKFAVIMAMASLAASKASEK